MSHHHFRISDDDRSPEPGPGRSGGAEPAQAKVLRIGFAVRSMDEKWGIGVYTRELLQRVLGLDTRNQYFILYGSAEHLGTFAGRPNVREIHLPFFSKLVWDQVQVAYTAAHLHLDVVFSPKMSGPVLFPGRMIFAIHGAEQFVRSRDFPLADRLYVRAFLPLLARRASRVLAMSHAVVPDLTHYLHVPPQKLAVTHLGAKEVFLRDVTQEAIESTRRRFGLNGPYVLHVGRTDAWKNFDELPQVMEILHARDHRVVLVHAGPPRRWRGELDWTNHRYIREVGFVSDEDLAALYNGATALVFPSVYEGFGIPLVEAMASGCPVVTAGWGAMREVCGDAALLVDTHDPEAIANAVERILIEPGLREDLVRRGRERASDLTWDATARRTLELIFEVAGVSAPGHN